MVLLVDEKPLAVILDNIPGELPPFARWVCWRAVFDGRNLTKMPVLASNPRSAARKNKPADWCDFSSAVESYLQHRDSANGSRVDGIGIVCGAGLVAIDMDECVGADGELTPEAADVVRRFNYTYAELSPSGRGVRLFLLGELPGKSITAKAAGVELYGAPNYVTVTGHRLEGAPTTVATGGEELTKLYAELDAKVKLAVKGRRSKATPPRRADRPASTPRGADEAVKMALRFNRSKAEPLLGGDTSGYPTVSEAELALANILAFYAGPGGEAAVEEAIRSSGLGRPKNDERRGDSTHLALTVAKAYTGRTDFYGDRGGGAVTLNVVATEGGVIDGPADWGNEATLTEVGLGRRLVAKAGGTLRWVTEHRDWMRWDGRRWLHDGGGLLATQIGKAVGKELWDELHRLGPDGVKKWMLTFTKAAGSAKTIRAAVELARSEPGVPVSVTAMDADPWILNCRNGTLNLQTFELLPHDHAQLCTHLAEVDFDPKANAPRWRQFIDEVTGGDAELAGFLQRSLGIVLSGDVREQHLWIHHGLGANGKSTALEVIAEMMGSYAGPAPAELLLARERGGEAERQLVPLAGKRLVLTAELPAGRRWDEVTVKRLTGGDTLAARKLYGEQFEIRPSWKLHVAANHRPAVRGTDHAIWRRLLLVPWSQRFDGARADAGLGEKLLAERSGILNWLLGGLQQWRGSGLLPPESVTTATGEYAEENDSIRTWMDEKTVRTPKAVAEVNELFKSYSDWCDARGERGVSFKELALELERRGFKSRRESSGLYRNRTVRIGIGFSAPPSVDDN
jgi:putative DNA primase/helicase